MWAIKDKEEYYAGTSERGEEFSMDRKYAHPFATRAEAERKRDELFPGRTKKEVEIVELYKPGKRKKG